MGDWEWGKGESGSEGEWENLFSDLRTGGEKLGSFMPVIRYSPPKS